MNLGPTGTATSRALDALKSGTDVGAAAYGEPSKDSSPGFNVDTGLDDDFSEDSPTPEGMTDEREGQQVPETQVAAKEEILLNGKKVAADWNDPKTREQIKRELARASGVSKLQSERDQVLAQKRELEAKYKELSDIWSALEGTYKTKGAKGVFNLLAGKDDAYDAQVKSDMVRQAAYAAASPEQKAFLEMQEQLEAERAEKNRILADVKAETERSKADRVAADKAQAEATVHPIFDKYRFAGKLGDEAVERQFDEAIWSRAIQNIQDVPEHELTQARIDKEFRTVAATFQKFLKDQGSKKADEVIQKKKENATAAVSAAAVKGMTGAVKAGSVRERVAAGDYKSSLMDVLTGKVRL